MDSIASIIYVKIKIQASCNYALEAAKCSLQFIIP